MLARKRDDEMCAARLIMSGDLHIRGMTKKKRFLRRGNKRKEEDLAFNKSKENVFPHEGGERLEQVAQSCGGS